MKKFICKKSGLLGMLSDRRGEMTYIDTVVSMVVIMLLVVLILNIFSFLTLKQDLSYFSEELAEAASLSGSVSTEVESRFSGLCSELGFDESDVSYSFEGTEFMDGEGNIQYGELICVSVSCKTKISGSGIFTLPATVTAASSCLCEKYTKTEY